MAPTSTRWSSAARRSDASSSAYASNCAVQLNRLRVPNCRDLSLDNAARFGHYAPMRRLVRTFTVISILAVAVTACSQDEADSERCGGVSASCSTSAASDASASTTSASSTIALTTDSGRPITTSVPSSSALEGENIVVTETVRSVEFVSTGSPVEVCSDAVTTALEHNSPWQGIVLKDETVSVGSTSTRWLFCYGEGASGEGVEALWSTNSRDWRFMRLGFGSVHHGGDAPAAVVFDNMRAAVTYDTIVGERHSYAYTRDGGQTWTRMDLPTYPTPAP